jgi:hypothetical protein
MRAYDQRNIAITDQEDGRPEKSAVRLMFSRVLDCALAYVTAKRLRRQQQLG